LSFENLDSGAVTNGAESREWVVTWVRTGFGTEAKVRESGCEGAGTDEGGELVRTVRLIRGEAGAPKIAWAGRLGAGDVITFLVISRY